MRSALAVRIIIAFVFSLTLNESLRACSMSVEIPAQEDLAAAQDEKERARLGELVERRLDLGERHLAVIVRVEITVNAPLVAPVRQMEVHAQRNPEAQRFRAHLAHQAAQRVSFDKERPPLDGATRWPHWPSVGIAPGTVGAGR